MDILGVGRERGGVAITDTFTQGDSSDYAVNHCGRKD